jgi:acyl CoA:acetate/3-ketoacid CoA transferase
VIYITERAVFELAAEGLRLIEVAPGVDLVRDVLERMPFEVALHPSLRERAEQASHAAASSEG